MKFFKTFFKLKISFKVFILNIFLSFAFLFFFQNNLQFNIKVFIFSCLVSLFFWQFIEIISNFIKSKLIKSIYFIIVSFLLTFLYVSTFFLFREFQSFINASMLKFIIDDYEYFFNYIKVYLFNFNGFIFLIVWFALFFSLFYNNIFSEINSKKTYKENIKLIVFIILVLVILNNIKKDVVNKFMSLDSSFLMAVKNVYRLEKKGKKQLYTSFNRLEVKKSDKKSDYNILLIINESFNKYGLGIYDKKSEYCKFINNYLDSVKDRLVVFNNFYSNSGVTDVSIPSIMTGVSPENSSDKLHTLPLIWNYAIMRGQRV